MVIVRRLRDVTDLLISIFTMSSSARSIFKPLRPERHPIALYSIKSNSMLRFCKHGDIFWAILKCAFKLGEYESERPRWPKEIAKYSSALTSADVKSFANFERIE